MKRFVHILLSLIILVPFVGCRRAVEGQLGAAEALMDVNPDSAMSILQQMNPDDFEEKNKMLHALLSEKAVIKAHKNIESDSMARVIMDYYDSRGDSLEVLSKLYYGKALRQHKKFEEALVPLTLSYDLAVGMNDYRSAGLAACELAFIYKKLFICEEQLKWAQLEKENYKKGSLSLHEAWADLDVVDALIKNDRYDEAYTIVCHLDSLRPDNSSSFLSRLKLQRPWIAHQQNKPDEALIMYEQLLDEGIRPSGSIWYIMGSDYLKIGQPAKAKDALASLKPLVKTSLDSIWMINLEASIAAAEGDYQSAYSKSSEFGSAIVEDGDRRISHLASGILMEALRKNYILERKVSRAERQKKNILAVAGVLAVFALLLLCLYLYALLKAKRRDMESIGSQVMELKIEVDELNKNADAKDRETKAEIQRFLLERVNFLNDLCEAWFRHKNMVKMNGIIRELEKLRGEDNRLKLEKIINRCSDNVMERFRVVFPDLPQEHYSYVMYHIAGFSTGSIAVLLGKENANAVYGVKARIKEQLGRNTLPEAAELRNRLGL